VERKKGWIRIPHERAWWFWRFLPALFAPRQKPDGPVPFGYKIGWIAVKSTSTAEVASSVGIRSPRSAGRQEGIDAAYNNALAFVTPPISGWVCIVEEPTMHRNGNPAIEAISKAVVSLSSNFG